MIDTVRDGAFSRCTYFFVRSTCNIAFESTERSFYKICVSVGY
jgi:hypothetical protein